MEVIFIVIAIGAGGPGLLLPASLVALRFGPRSDSSGVARCIRGWKRVLTASPVYLANAGVPQIPAESSAHDSIVGRVSVTTSWSLRRDGGTTTSVRIEGLCLGGVNSLLRPSMCERGGLRRVIG